MKHNQKYTPYYCEVCGLELYMKGRLCADCANERRNTNLYFKKKKRHVEEESIPKSGKLVRHLENGSGR